MKLNYITPPSHAGGSAVPGVGTIYMDEVTGTLDALSDDLELHVNLNNYRIGSTGKRRYSGDLDIVLDTIFWDSSSKTLAEELKNIFGESAVARNGTIVHLAYPISNYDTTKNEVGPRTGYVQVDFKIGDYDWLNFYHHSSANSAYKGAHRNLAIAAICRVKDNFNNGEFDQLGRAVEEVRYKFSDKGFCRILRQGVWSPVHKKYTKAQKDTIIGGKYTQNEEEIVKALFTNGTVDDLDSLESLIAAVRRDFDAKDQDLIFAAMAKNFMEWPEGKLFHYPPEITTFIP